MNNRLKYMTLNEVNEGYMQGTISEKDTIEYIKLWNSECHITQAVIFDGMIRNFDPEINCFHRSLYKKFGVKE